MFNGHSMSLITDMNMVANDIKNIDFMLVATITSTESYEAPNIYYAGVLMPPTDMLMKWADGDYLILQNEYPQYLLSKDCDDMIVALIASMTKRNVVLYIPKDEYDVYGELLLRHLYLVFGITCNTPFSRFSVIPEKIPFIMAKFYMLNIMDPQEFLMSYPINYPLPDFVINKLVMDIRPVCNMNMTFLDYKNYFENLRRPKLEQPKRQIYHLRKDTDIKI